MPKKRSRTIFEDIESLQKLKKTVLLIQYKEQVLKFHRKTLNVTTLEAGVVKLRRIGIGAYAAICTGLSMTLAESENVSVIFE
jgi:hypothetical protein